MQNSVRQSYSFKRILTFNVDSTDMEIHGLQDGGYIYEQKECPAPRSQTSTYRMIPLPTPFLSHRTLPLKNI